MLADAVKIKTWFCKKHRIPNNFHAFSWRYDVDGFLDKDFQLITGLKVGRRQYVRRMPLIVVSRKALRVLLDGRCKGLTKEGFFLKESFTPCL
jgi:hypothetical protein